MKYFANGVIEAFTYGNGVAHTKTLNPEYQIEDIKDETNSALVNHLRYSYDSNDNISQILNLKAFEYSLNAISYDGLDRLTDISGGANIGNTQVEYDGLGNITYYQTKHSTLDYVYDRSDNKNRLISVTGTGSASKSYSSFHYDPSGNVIYNGHRSFDYNALGQMTSSGSFSYLYNGNNKRVYQHDSNGPAYSVYGYDGKLRYLETSDGGTNHIYLNNQIIARDGIARSENGYQHFKAFGKSVDGATDNVGYTGHKYDTAIDLNYMQARYYDPVIGRFYSNDPVGWTPKNPVMSFNRYLYVNNNPYKYTDPNGEFLDAIVDIGFIAYDLYDMATNGVNATNSASLGANVAGLFIPGATGLGLAARAWDKGVDAANALRRTCCFVAGTQVLTEDGYKNIEDVKLGEKLWAKNTETGEQDWKPVTKVFIEPDRGIFEIKLVASDGFEQKIQATDDHPFYVIGKGWKQTIELKVGDKIETDGNGAMEVVSVIDEQRLDLTYNFTVADFHTYYVTKKNVLVHNCNYIPAPKEIEGISGLTPAKPKTSVQGGGGLRKRWKDKKGNIYEWDSQHGTLEKYNKRGKHQGEFDPKTGEQTKPKNKKREVEP
ncbi:MAG: hypothetical protein GJ671_00040 [Alteromonadaceae bacterium]|nr:hypothetical protein [Alteromonadaceae bacterium]